MPRPPGVAPSSTPQQKKMPRPPRAAPSATPQPSQSASSSMPQPSPSAPSSTPRVTLRPASSQCLPWPCQECGKMPWRCLCRPRAQEAAGLGEVEFFKQASLRAGVWEAAEEDQVEAKKHEAREDSPEPDKESALWVCKQCNNMSTVHQHNCRTCGLRRPLMQKFRMDLGDWFCVECNNHNRGYRHACNWSACETRDWMCSCGNLNRSNRKYCIRRSPLCGLPRPHDYD